MKAFMAGAVVAAAASLLGAAASTRQILLHANAGKIIFAFGNFVVGGNYVVGGVIFLIITIVQF